MILFINTASTTPEIGLVGKKIEDRMKIKGEKHLSQTLLPGIQLIFNKNKANLGDCRAIAVVIGPGGGFSRVRTGVAVANALAYTLGVPLRGLVEEDVPSNLKDLQRLKFSKKMVLPKYGRKPNITTRKSLK